MKSDKELYRQLRALPGDQLWDQEVPRFNAADARERVARVAVIRAVGVAFAGAGTAEQKNQVRDWLRGLLQDPSEKVRRYAMAALPKIGSGVKEEGELLTLLRKEPGEREMKFLGRALNKIGGTATLKAMSSAPGGLAQTEQKVRASVARKEQPSTVRLDHVIPHYHGICIRLRCRKGLEKIVQDEVEEFLEEHGGFRALAVRDREVAIGPLAPFCIADLYAMRCFSTLSFELARITGSDPAKEIADIAAAIASPRSRYLFKNLTAGPARYRLEFPDRGHQRGAVQEIADQAYALAPEILNDARLAPWSVDVHAGKVGHSVELRPRLHPDPRLAYRLDDVPAASHPPLAACMARLAGDIAGKVIWDPFCGSGLELVECALRGGVRRVIGTDISAEAIAIAQANFDAAKIRGTKSSFLCSDFRDFEGVEGLGPRSVSLIITNPPMGRRIRIPDMHGFFTDFFDVAAEALKPGGLLIFPNPMKLEPRDPSLRLRDFQMVDLGGFNCRLEVYVKTRG